MGRKKWTAQQEITEALLKSREKRRWQLAYRRYVLENTPSELYAFYFGLDNSTLRKWFECQFTEGINWGNFGKAWQFDHIVPTTYFKYNETSDLVLCWSFINIRVGPLEESKSPNPGGIDLLAVRLYFENLYHKTGFSLCQQMLEKIEAIERSGLQESPSIERFLVQHKEYLETVRSLTKEEFSKLNSGTPVSDILLEREILRKFG